MFSPARRTTNHYPQDINGVLWSEDTQVRAPQSLWPIKSPTLSGFKARLTRPFRYHFKAQDP